MRRRGNATFTPPAINSLDQRGRLSYVNGTVRLKIPVVASFKCLCINAEKRRRGHVADEDEHLTGAEPVSGSIANLIAVSDTWLAEATDEQLDLADKLFDAAKLNGEVTQVVTEDLTEAKNLLKKFTLGA